MTAKMLLFLLKLLCPALITVRAMDGKAPDANEPPNEPTTHSNLLTLRPFESFAPLPSHHGYFSDSSSFLPYMPPETSFGGSLTSSGQHIDQQTFQYVEVPYDPTQHTYGSDQLFYGRAEHNQEAISAPTPVAPSHYQGSPMQTYQRPSSALDELGGSNFESSMRSNPPSYTAPSYAFNEFGGFNFESSSVYPAQPIQSSSAAGHISPAGVSTDLLAMNASAGSSMPTHSQHYTPPQQTLSFDQFAMRLSKDYVQNVIKSQPSGNKKAAFLAIFKDYKSQKIRFGAGIKERIQQLFDAGNRTVTTWREELERNED